MKETIMNKIIIFFFLAISLNSYAQEKDTTFFKSVELDERKQTFVSLLYYCGLRKGECLALKKSDFDFKKKTLSITKVIIFANDKPELKDYPKSDNGIRAIPIPDDCITIIISFVESSEGFLFHGENSDMMTQSAYRRMWDSIIYALNIAAGWKKGEEKPIQDLTAHIFRHNYCTQLCYQIPKISTKMIARLMGDTEKVVLEVYSHIVEEKENISAAVNSL